MRLRLVVAMVVAAVAGCGGDDGDDTAGSAPSESTTATQGTTTTTTTTSSGDDGDEGGGGDQRDRLKDPRTAVEAILTSGDPAKACGSFVTKHYLRQAYGGRQGCIQAQAPGSAARSLRDVHVAIDDLASNGILTAEVTAVPVGGPYDGEEVRVILVGRVGPSQREFLPGGWRVFGLEADVPVGP